jgi:hypothetical protein
MDLTTMLIVGGLILAIVVAALFVLNRSWGNFPDRIGGLPPVSSSAPGISPQVPTPWNQLDAERELLEQQQTEQISTAEPATGLVLIEHPMVRRAAESALKKGSSAARYIVRDGERFYFSFEQISDPVQRQAAYDLMRRYQAGEDVDIRAMLRLVQELFKS